jgi:hypothetical protein
VGLDYLSTIEYGECGGGVGDQLPYENLFVVNFIVDYLEEISLF